MAAHVDDQPRKLNVDRAAGHAALGSLDVRIVVGAEQLAQVRAKWTLPGNREDLAVVAEILAYLGAGRRLKLVHDVGGGPLDARTGQQVSLAGADG